jgi:hypothetical protein
MAYCSVPSAYEGFRKIQTSRDRLFALSRDLSCYQTYGGLLYGEYWNDTFSTKEVEILQSAFLNQWFVIGNVIVRDRERVSPTTVRIMC